MVFAPKVLDNTNWCRCMDLLSRYPDVDHDENINAVMRVVSLFRGYQEQKVIDEVEDTRERLNEMVLSDLCVICRNKKLPVSGTKADLCVICRNKKLPVSGTKAVLVERIIAGGAGAVHDNSRQQEAPTVLSVLNEDMVHCALQIKSLSGRDIK